MEHASTRLLRRLNPYCAQALSAAASLCQSRAHGQITVEHWLLKLLEQGEGDLTVIARRQEWDMDALWRGLLAHLDTLPRIGGGYLPKARERLWLTKPRRFTVPANRPVEAQPAWAEARFKKVQLEGTMVAVDGELNIKAWPIVPAPRGPQEPTSEDYFLTIELDRPVRGELSLIPLRVMRDLAVRHGVPFDVIADEDERFQLPKELKPIAERILDQTLGELEVNLDRDQENLLRSRYIHQSAHWVPSGPFLVSKPTENGQRNIYPNRPQKGYPQ